MLSQIELIAVQRGSTWPSVCVESWRSLSIFLRVSWKQLLASLEEKSTCKVLGCFLEARDRDNLEEEFLVGEAARDRFALFWRAVAVPEVEAFPCF